MAGEGGTRPTAATNNSRWADPHAFFLAHAWAYVRGAIVISPHLGSEEADRIFRQRQDVEHEVHSVSLLSDDSLQRWPGRGALRARQVDKDVHL